MLGFNIEDTAMILVDHQVGTNTWAQTTQLALLRDSYTKIRVERP